MRRALLFVALIFVMFFATFAQSQQPSPTKGKASQPQQRHSETAHQPPATNERGTEQAPIVVKILPTPKTEAEAAQEAKEREQSAANDQEIISYNNRLIVIGVLQLIVFVGQLIVFGLQAYQLWRTVNSTLILERCYIFLEIREIALAGKQLVVWFRLAIYHLTYHAQ